MVDIKNIQQFTVQRPNTWTLFGSVEDFDSLPETHKSQIFFLDKTACKFIYEFSSAAKLVTGDISNPFAKGNFKIVEVFSDFSNTDESRKQLKKWLFNRGISFQTWVFVLPNYNDYPVLTTWKMIVKYSGDIFFNDDITIFDESINWCLFYFHHDKLFFGKDNIYDPADDYKKMEAVNEVKKMYPNFKLLY